MVETAKCPSCGYPRTFATGKCTRCGYQFPSASPGDPERITHQPEAEPAPPSQALPPPEGLPMCIKHQTVQASAGCDYCGADICSTCDVLVPSAASSDSILNIGRNRHVCPNCMTAPGSRPARGLQPEPQPQPLGVNCINHPDVNAVRRCGLCSAAMCATCDFEFPGRFHLCPACATNPQRALSPRRKKLIGFGYALAAWATLVLAVAASGALAEIDQNALGVVLMILIFVPTVGGTALSFSALDKRLGNPPVIWGAVIWNGVLLALWVVFSVIGSLT